MKTGSRCVPSPTCAPRLRPGLLALLALPLATASPAAGGDGTTLRARMDRRLEAVQADLIAIRHDLHRHPDASGQEVRTAGVIAGRLRKLGLDVRTDVGGHGVVAVLKGVRPGATVAYRADIDATRTDLPDPAPFRSETPGVRHICGHDVHAAVALGIAEALAAIRSDLPGAVKLIFQPEEENSFDGYLDRSAPVVRGARAMIRDGALGAPRPGAIFAVHTAPLRTGQIAAVPGIALAGADSVVVRLSGGGDLRAAAEAVKGIIASANTLPPRERVFADGMPKAIGPFVQTEVLSTSAEGKEWVVRAIVRASAQEEYARTKATVLKTIRGFDRPGIATRIEYEDRIAPDNINDPELVRMAAADLREVVGPEGALIGGEAIPYFGEDFAFYLRDVPGVMFWLGVSRPERNVLGVPHAPFYQADDDAILVGARAMSRVLLSYLERQAH